MELFVVWLSLLASDGMFEELELFLVWLSLLAVDLVFEELELFLVWPSASFTPLGITIPCAKAPHATSPSTAIAANIKFLVMLIFPPYICLTSTQYLMAYT